MNIPRTAYAHPAGESPTYDMLLTCSRCGTCLPACPSYAATMSETCSPRGRVQLVRALEEGTLTNSERLREALFTCLDCRACETVCPNGIHPGILATEKRAELQEKMFFTRKLKRYILGPVLSHPRWLEVGLGAMRIFYQRTGLQRLVRFTGLLKIVPAMARMERYLPPIPGKSVLASLPDVAPAVGAQRGRIGFFVGCAMNTVFADVTRHSIRALTRLGYEVVIPKNVVCCGAPQVSLSEFDLARQMAHRNLRLFDGLDYIVTDCAACGSELKHYAKLLDDPAAEEFCSRVRDFAEFVEPLMPEGTVDIGPVTYHAPCHLAHAQCVCTQPKALLRRLCPEYRELPEHDRCCGSAGMYWTIYPDIAEDSLARKLNNIRATGAAVVVTANPGCLLQLMGGKTEDDQWDVKHISEIVDQALEPPDESGG
ncbi:MAG: (Fe-S)-binding protein [Armatimonadota bacterium]